MRERGGVLPKVLVEHFCVYKKGNSGLFLTKPIFYTNGNLYADKNEILVNTKKPSVILLHELSHADSYNNSKFLESFCKMRFIAPIINNTARNQASLGINNDKAYKTFLHKNSAKISALV